MNNFKFVNPRIELSWDQLSDRMGEVVSDQTDIQITKEINDPVWDHVWPTLTCIWEQLSDYIWCKNE